jgi:hypothetical protein
MDGSRVVVCVWESKGHRLEAAVIGIALLVSRGCSLHPDKGAVCLCTLIANMSRTWNPAENQMIIRVIHSMNMNWSSLVGAIIREYLRPYGIGKIVTRPNLDAIKVSAYQRRR